MNKKRYISIFLLVFAILTILIASDRVFAEGHRLINQEISVYVNEDGSARIIDKRHVHLIEGTENYIVIGNLGKSEIKDFIVREGDILYEFQERWDIKKSREEKTYKNGIVYTSDGYELCWGIGDYGYHDYQLEYTVTNFVKELKDKQMIFWRFINDKTNIPPENASVTIDGDIKFTDDNSNIWAFGYKGYIRFSEDKIFAYSDQAFDRSNYLTILVEFDKGLYGTNDFVNRDFEDVREGAFDGSDYGADIDIPQEKGFLGKTFGAILTIFASLVGLFVSLMVIIGLAKSKDKGFKNKQKEFRGEYYREYPHEGNFEEIYYLLNKISIASLKDLMTAFILKWIYKGYIRAEHVERGLIFKKEDVAYRFIEDSIDESYIEKELYNIMLGIGGASRLVDNKNIQKWTSRNYRILDKWEEELINLSLIIMEDLGYVKEEKEKILFFSHKYHSLTEEGKDLEEKVYKFKNYLEDFSLLNEHEAVNVKIWDYLMIWAGILGITEAIIKEFKKIYPNYENESIYRYNGIYFASSFATSTARAASRARSSGSGGSSSFGGGGGSFGGGSGGGTR